MKTYKFKLYQNKRKRIQLAKLHFSIVNKRRDWFWKLSHKLCNTYDVMCFETLNLKGMQRLWGKKISDLAFSSFLEILQTVAALSGKQIVFVDKWFSSSKLCSKCGYKHSGLKLRDREWVCPSCETHHLRDKNASLNIEIEGASSINLDTVRLPLGASIA